MSINNEITTRGFKFCKGRPFHLKGYQLQSHLWHSESLLLSISTIFQNCRTEQVGWSGSGEGRGPGSPRHERGEGSWRKVEATEGSWKQRLRNSEGPGHQRSWGKSESLQFWLLETFCLGSPVLKPNLDLSLRELQLGGELCSLSYRQVLLLSELLLQGVQLLGSEGGPRFPVWFMFP